MDAGKSLRDPQIHVGDLKPGPTRSIAAWADVSVGRLTVVRDEPDPRPGAAPRAAA